MFYMWEDGHKVVDCPDRKVDRGEAHIIEAQKRDAENIDADNGRSLGMHKILLTPEKEVES
jgi:hypothetical protein